MSPEQPLVSIVTPSFNQARFLETTMRSVLHQSYPRVQYIVMDGGSTDGSVEIIKRHAARLHYWHSQPDRGAADAIHLGFQRSTGRILAWLNSDDVLAEDAVANAVAALARRPDALMVYGNRVCIDAESRLLYYRPSLPVLSRTRFICTILPQEACFWRRDAYDTVGGMDLTKRFAFDYALFSRIAQRGPIVHGSGVWAFFRKHGESMTMQLTDTVGMEEGAAVQDQVWKHRISPLEWRMILMVVRSYALVATPFVRKPAWPACLPPAKPVRWIERIHRSLHETSPLKKVLGRFLG